jgi:hypothetical protein
MSEHQENESFCQCPEEKCMWIYKKDPNERCDKDIDKSKDPHFCGIHRRYQTKEQVRKIVVELTSTNKIL